MKPVRGFQTKYGRFFTTEWEAELNEAELELIDALSLTPRTYDDNDAVIEMIRLCAIPIRRYLDAQANAPQAEAQTDREATSGDMDEAEEDEAPPTREDYERQTGITDVLRGIPPTEPEEVDLDDIDLINPEEPIHIFIPPIPDDEAGDGSPPDD